MLDILPNYRPEGALITRGMEAWHDFKAGAGLDTLADLSNNNRIGTLQNAPQWSNGGLSFVGASTQYVSRTDPTPATVHALAVARVSSIAGTQTIAGRWGSDNATRGWIFQINASAQLVFAKSNGAGTAVLTTTATVSANTWFFAEAISNGTSSMMARLNGTGAYSTSASVAGATNTGGVFAIARQQDATPTNYLTGDIAYLLQFNRQLSADEVSATVQALRALLSTRGVTF